ncbi:MAG: hypothetical protein JXE06_04505 [Coriobacteriia bacterium]|nr:hypothetical protein [Coriobacteriia bacterium]MBN2823080.1 hypothetical protein [Coriobacteriia bacterium]
MSRNRAIKQFDPRKTGHSLDLFTENDARLPVVLELLKSPWILRASELPDHASGSSGKHVEREIDVVWDGARRCPVSFTDRQKRFSVDALIQTWTLERSWWDRRRRVSRRCFRVLARGGVYDLAYDRLERRWTLIGIVD